MPVRRLRESGRAHLNPIGAGPMTAMLTFPSYDPTHGIHTVKESPNRDARPLVRSPG